MTLAQAMVGSVTPPYANGASGSVHANGFPLVGWGRSPHLLAALAFASAPALAQTTPAGLWRSIDDKTGEAKAEIRIVEKDGIFTGRIERRLAKDARADAKCEECTDERKGKPIDGLEIIRGVRKAEGKDGVWDGGKVLDPENGREYSARLTPVDGGRKLEMRGSFGPFGRTQTWVRVQPQ